MAAEEKEAFELIEIIRTLGAELKVRSRSLEALTLDSSFDSDLGLDSLARVELLARIERRFGIKLPDRVFAGVDTPRELLHEILRAGHAKESRPFAVPEAVPQAASADVSQQAQTLVEVLEWHARVHPDRPHLKFYRDDEEEDLLTYGQLRAGAQRVAAALQRLGLKPGDRVSLMLPTGRDYFMAFMGVLVGGGVPVPIYPPVRLQQLEDHLLRHRGILSNCQAAFLITFEEVKALALLLKSQVPSLSKVVTPGELMAETAQLLYPRINAEDTALLQYTSGSTGMPKGVALSHRNLLANICAMGERIEVVSSDVFVSWLPLYHDMGLIGAWLGTLYYAAMLVVMSPLSFLAKPERWLWAIHRNRATMTAAPNFAYELCLKRIRDEDIRGIRLDSMRAVFNGAEAVIPATLERFHRRFAGYGLKKTALMPVYGLAECSVGLTFPPLGRGPLVDRVARDRFMRTARAEPASGPDNALCFVSCGDPLPDHEIRIVDALGHELPERQQGRLQFRGPSVTCGYYRNPEENKRLFDRGWVNSGDFAYIAGGEVYITGREKDIIIHAGRNVYPHELEEAVNEIDGIRKGCVAVFGCPCPETGTERLVVLAETRETDPRVLEKIRSQINAVATALAGNPPDDVVLAPPHSVLKTSSGKIRRTACRELYEQGLIGVGAGAPWRQLLRLVLASVAPQLRRTLLTTQDLLYAGYAWLLTIPLASLVWFSVIACPSLSWRWKLIRSALRFLAFATATKVAVKGLENLPPRGAPCVFVSNHASYLDSMALIHSLPIEFSFVAKIELNRQYFTGRLLRRLQTEFVERFDMQKGAEDAKRIARVAAAGRQVMFFVEGTFTRMPGLRPFRMGAFLTAAEAGLPIIPIIIRGTRSKLRAESWFPRRGAISISIGEPVRTEATSGGDAWSMALSLRDRVRWKMLAEVGEPDLAYGKPQQE